MKCRQAIADRDGYVLNAEVKGSGDPVVLLHPVGLSGSSWSEVSGRLRGFRTITVDLRGFGGSVGFPEAESMDDYARDVLSTLSTLGISRFHLVGLSFGGMITQRIAILRPELVRSVVISGCGCTFPPAIRTILAERGKRAEREGMDAIIPETIERWFSPDFIASGGARSVEATLAGVSVSAWANAWNAISKLDNTDALAGLTLPALCIAGENDGAAPPAMLSGVADSLAGARLVVLRGAVHMMHIENAEAYAITVLEFLKAHQPS